MLIDSLPLGPPVARPKGKFRESAREIAPQDIDSYGFRKPSIIKFAESASIGDGAA